MTTLRSAFTRLYTPAGILPGMVSVLSRWSSRRWAVALGATLATTVVIALPTAMIPTPIFGREIATTWWAWPVLIASSALSGLLLATYVREPGDPAFADGVNRTGTVGGLLTFFAVGCPVCNKVALIALGYAGALQWFAPIQPYLGAGGIALLAWALRARLRGEASCAVPAAS